MIAGQYHRDGVDPETTYMAGFYAAMSFALRHPRLVAAAFAQLKMVHDTLFKMQYDQPLELVEQEYKEFEDAYATYVRGDA